MDSELLWKVHDRIVDEVTLGGEIGWNQNNWGRTGPACGTTACIAGWTCIVAGDTLAYDLTCDDAICTCNNVFAEYAVKSNGDRERIELRATELLQFEREEALRVFYNGADTLGELTELITEVAGPRP